MKLIVSLVIGVLVLLYGTAAHGAETVSYEEDGLISREVGMPVYRWYARSEKPRAQVLLLHGVALHGRSYDVLGRELAAMGLDVYATDMRGYGRHASSHEFCSKGDCKRKLSYERSFQDLLKLTRHLRCRQPELPLYLIGESLGATMSIRLAGCHPDIADGLILSAPAVRRQPFIDPYLLANASLFVANPWAQLNLKPFVKKYGSNDPRIIEEKLNDPLLRQSLSAWDLLQTNRAVRSTLKYVSGISPDIPVLIIQGGADRCIKANAVVLVLQRLRSSDQTVRWFHERGHILLETAYIKPDTMDTVRSWLFDRVNGSAPGAAFTNRVALDPGGIEPPREIPNELGSQYAFISSTERYLPSGMLV